MNGGDDGDFMVGDADGYNAAGSGNDVMHGGSGDDFMIGDASGGHGGANGSGDDVMRRR